jgi:hypothetical protein
MFGLNWLSIRNSTAPSNLISGAKDAHAARIQEQEKSSHLAPVHAGACLIWSNQGGGDEGCQPDVVLV